MIPVAAIAGAPATRGAVLDALPPLAQPPRPLTLPQPDANWNLLLICVATYMLTSVGRVHQLWPAVGLVRPTMLSAAVALVCVLLDERAIARLRASLRQPLLRWQVCLLVWAFLTIPLALYPRAALDVVTSLLKTLLMVLAIATAVRGPRDVHRLACTYFAATAAYAIYVLTHFEVDSSLARYNRLIYYDANEYALLAICSLPFGVYAIWSAGSAWLRLVVIACMVAVCLTFVDSGSRGATLALAGGLLVVVARVDVVKLRWRLGGLAVIVLAFALTASDQLWQRFDSVVDTEDDYNLTAPTGRIEVWKRGIGYMLDHPVLGVGAGNFPTAEGRLSEYAALMNRSSRGIKWSAAHNSFVQVGAELGVPGLLFFLMTLYSAIRTLNRAASPRARAVLDPQLVGVAYAGLIALPIFLLGALFLSLAYHDMLFTLLAIALAIAVVARRAMTPLRPGRA